VVFWIWNCYIPKIMKDEFMDWRSSSAITKRLCVVLDLNLLSFETHSHQFHGLKVFKFRTSTRMCRFKSGLCKYYIPSTHVFLPHGSNVAV
jgi:hypothetical protein